MFLLIFSRFTSYLKHLFILFLLLSFKCLNFFTNPRDVFRAQSNICDEVSLLRSLLVNYVRTKAESRMLNWALNMPLELTHFECRRF